MGSMMVGPVAAHLFCPDDVLCDANALFPQLSNFSSGYSNGPDELQVAGFNQDLFDFFQDTMQSDWMVGTRRWMGEQMQVRDGGDAGLKGGGGSGNRFRSLYSSSCAVSGFATQLWLLFGFSWDVLVHQEEEAYHDLCQRMCLCKGGPCSFKGDGDEQVSCSSCCHRSFLELH